MSQSYKKLNINIPDSGNYNNYYYSYNDNSNIYDLLESFAFNYPTLNICPCYLVKIKVYENNTYIWKDIDKREKMKNINCSNIQILNGNNCTCNETIKNNYTKNKLDIINSLQKEYNDKKDLNIKILNLNKEIKSLNREIKNLTAQIKNLNYYIKTLENDKSNLIKEKKNLETKIFQILDKVDILGNKNELAKKEINQLKTEIIAQNKQNRINEKRINDLKLEKDQLIQERKENEQLNKDTNFTDFYDVIIDIKSIKDISKGWRIKMSEKAKKNYDNYKNEENLKIGIIGNANKGKSFLLSKISKIKLPSGTSIRTEGLSIKYPDLEGFKNRKIVLLDSAGLETPVLKEDKETITKEEEKQDKELFKEKSREKIITELFLQNFIINNSDVLIIVVGILTYSEQKLLNRIKTEFLKSRNKNKIDKPLFIIHNLMTYETIQQVEEYIDDYLLKSATFELKIGHNISTKQSAKKGVYFYEKNLNQKIFHLIFGRDKSEAGIFYNDSTLEFLENIYQNVINLKSFDVIETVKDSFIEISKDILEKTEHPLNKNNFDNSNKELIKISNANNFALKKCLIDELGFSNLKANSFDPTYNCYKDGNKIVIKVEAPGNVTFESSFDNGNQYYIIRINGTKKKDKFPEKLEDNIYNLREYGNFSLDIPISPDEFRIKNKSPTMYEKKGIVFIEYELEEKNRAVKYLMNEEDEI